MGSFSACPFLPENTAWKICAIPARSILWRTNEVTSEKRAKVDKHCCLPEDREEALRQTSRLHDDPAAKQEAAECSRPHCEDTLAMRLETS